MVKLKGPLASANAHGSIGKILTYSQRRSGNQVRKLHKPSVAASSAQRSQRRLTDFLVAHWYGMTDAQKATWETNAKASGLNLSGYHYFLKEAQRDLYTNHGLALYLPMNRIVSGEVIDLSGSGYNGSLGPSYPSNCPVKAISMNEKLNNCLYFDGVDDYVLVGDKTRLNLGTGDFSLCLIMYGDPDNDYHTPISKAGWDSTWKGWLYDFNNGGYSGFVLGNGTTHVTLGYIVETISIWQIVVIRRSGATLDWFINNVKVATVGSADLDVDVDEELVVGGNSDGEQNFIGKIDDVCVYNRALTDNEIAKRYDLARVRV